MYTLLYREPVVVRHAVRACVRERLQANPLIAACGDGDRGAVRAMLAGLWPFVQSFELAIDRQVARLPLKPLVARFGREPTHAYFKAASAAVREMKEEEGCHSELWRDGARELGVDLAGRGSVPGVAALVAAADTTDPVAFFCWLAGTEYVAEEVAAYLCSSKRFLNVFPGGRWTWGDAHTEQHEGASHLEIDEDLARAYHPEDDDAAAGATLTAGLDHCQQLFMAAADDVYHDMRLPQAA